jgi:hypothetical protein
VNVGNAFSSMNHRQAIEAASRCGCFYCLAVFPPSAITRWVDEDERGIGQTALCPKCEIDAVIADTPEHPVSEGLLRLMHLNAFGTPDRLN